MVKMGCYSQNYMCRVGKISRHHFASLPLVFPLCVFHYRNVLSPRLNASLLSETLPGTEGMFYIVCRQGLERTGYISFPGSGSKQQPSPHSEEYHRDQ